MRTFFDTNVLAYLFDRSEPSKQARAQKVLSDCAADGEVVLSAQVLEEFFVVVTRKLATPLPAADAEQTVRDLMAFPVVPIDGNLVLAAIDLARRKPLSFWDAAIVSAAKAGDAERILTEDLQDGEVIDGIRIENPFLETSGH